MRACSTVPDMRRRDFLAVLGAAGAWPIAARGAGRTAAAVVGLLSATMLDEREAAAFRQGLEDAGYVAGHNVSIEYRPADGRYDRLPALAAELVRRGVDVIVAIGGTPSAPAAKAATSTIPIVFSNGSDPVNLGLVSSLGRPSGNVTGVSFMVSALGAKRLALLRELMPAAAEIGFLVNPPNPNATADTMEIQAAARSLGVRLIIATASSESEIEAAFSEFARLKVDAVMVAADAFFRSRRDQLAAVASRHVLPATYAVREHAAAGGLMSYGTSVTEAYRQAGIYAGRILKGERPADLPVMQSTKFELVFNLATAKTLGLAIPPTLLARADEVIE
jgi:putative tryptophan/tyrosine transport system substrate-binding protein